MRTWRGGRVVFCAPEVGGRVLQVPQWMCDRAACSGMNLSASAVVGAEVLRELRGRRSGRESRRQ